MPSPAPPNGATPLVPKGLGLVVLAGGHIEPMDRLHRVPIPPSQRSADLIQDMEDSVALAEALAAR